MVLDKFINEILLFQFVRIHKSELWNFTLTEHYVHNETAVNYVNKNSIMFIGFCESLLFAC